MARNPVAAMFSLAIGGVLGAAGTLLAGWVVLTIIKVERGFEAMMWAAEHSPIPLTVSPVDLANRAIHSKLVFGIVAAFLCASSRARED